ncbi:NAD(P)H-hydrate dehydratase [Nocardioides nanhaiensis]|uniref:Bifunctional NAD(P)H-hydrate repair enzyme n=1 Tax=Nocardioides nanhaiensis TaxID=1476871 RepID=A0ABP8VXV1_9ACTN
MRCAHTVEQVRAAESQLMARLPEGALMQRAATGLGHAVAELLGGVYGRRVLLLVGSGDNGGDALLAGAMLARRGARVEAWQLGERWHDDGAAALRAAGGRCVTAVSATATPAPAAGGYDVVVDGVTGIGGRPGLRDAARAALDVALAAGTAGGRPLVVAVDTPSGVDVETGELPEGADHVRADLTVTFGTHKPVHLVEPGASACGAVHLVDLGLDLPPAPLEALQPGDVSALLPRPSLEAHKYTRGVVGVRAGSTTYPGAALLSVAGAASGLVGMVRYVGSDAVARTVREQHPEVVGEGRVQSWVVGSGSGDDAAQHLRQAGSDGVPVVVDADALAHLEILGAAEQRPPLVLTPHAGELARLLDVEREQVEERQLHHAREAAARFGATVLLKGPHTLAAAPDGRVRVTTTGTPWLATAGAGDVLGGVVGALLAAGLEPLDAASVGSWLHGAAATLAAAGGPIVAGDVARALPAVVRGLPLA